MDIRLPVQQTNDFSVSVDTLAQRKDPSIAQTRISDGSAVINPDSEQITTEQNLQDPIHFSPGDALGID